MSSSLEAPTAASRADDTSARPDPGRSARADDRLGELWHEIRELQAAADLLEWDQRVFMPARGREGRARTLAVLASTVHRRLVDPELVDLLGELEARSSAGSRERAWVEVARLEVDRARRIPESLVEALAAASSAGMGAWQAAREARDFGLFAPALERLLELRRAEAAAVLPHSPPYDAALQLFEPSATEAALAPLFESLAAELGPAVRERAAGAPADPDAASGSGREANRPFAGHFPDDRQEALVRRVADALGLDSRASRLDRSTHPFCFGLHPDDVRLTWRSNEADPRVGLFALLHEAGHALYEQGLPREDRRTPLGRDASFGLHESQARLVECHLGRSLGFWRWLWPHYLEAFPHAARGPSLEHHWRALFVLRPSPIRTEADPASYDLHIAIRFELERRLFSGDLAVAELPDAWNGLYRDVLGLEPRHDTEGVLQDIHWSEGLFGYFPAYTLGNMAAAQLFTAARRELGDFEESFAAGEFAPLVQWLRDRVHGHGSRYTTAEVVERATGRPLDTVDLLAHLEQHCALAATPPG